jgi:hypothetical protein
LAIPPAQPPVFLSPPNPTSPWDGIGQSINNDLTNHALTLMALCAGIAQGVGFARLISYRFQS